MKDKSEDEYSGQGGSYVIDPKTGQRRLVERTADAALPGQPNDAESAPADKPRKGD
jgi:hypothetical protein